MSTDRVGVTVGAFLTRVADAGVVQLAQKSWQTVNMMVLITPFYLKRTSDFKHHVLRHKSYEAVLHTGCINPLVAPEGAK